MERGTETMESQKGRGARGFWGRRWDFVGNLRLGMMFVHPTDMVDCATRYSLPPSQRKMWLLIPMPVRLELPILQVKYYTSNIS